LNWLKKIFSGSASEAKESLRLEDVISWLDDKEASAGWGESLSRIYCRLEEQARELSEDISLLASAEPDPSTPPKLLRAGLAARGEVVKQMESLEEKIAPPRKRDLQSASEHHWALVKGLERTVTTFGRAQRYVAALFPKSLESINSDLGQISRTLVELEELIGKRRKLSEEVWYSKELAREIQKGLAAIDSLKKKLAGEEELLASTSARLTEHEQRAKNLAASDAGRRTEELKSSLEERKREKIQTEEELRALISPLTKALGRITKQSSSDRISLEHGEVFLQLLNNPAKVSDTEIAGSLAELRAHLATLGLKDRKKEKVLDHIDQLIGKRSLELARSRHFSLSEEIELLEAQLKESNREALALKDTISQDKKTLRTLEAAAEQSRKDLLLLQDKMNAKQSELVERMTRIAGKEMSLILPEKIG